MQTKNVNDVLLKRNRRRGKKLSCDIEETHLFRPKTGKPPKGRKFSPSQVGEHLYSLAYKQIEVPANEHDTGTVKNQHSEVLMKKIKGKRFKEIFMAFGPVNGSISKDNAVDCKLTAPVLSLIQPIIDEIDDPITLSEFSDIMELYIRILSPIEKNRLLGTGKSRSTDTPPVTKPRVKHERPVVDLYDRFTSKRNEVKARVEKDRLRKAASERELCTFKPNIK